MRKHNTNLILVLFLSLLLVGLIILAIFWGGNQYPSSQSKSSHDVVSELIQKVETNHLDENGIISPECVSLLIDDIYDTVKKSEYVKHIEKHDTSVYMILDDGVGCHYLAPIPGLASSGSDLAIYGYQPWYSNFEKENTDYTYVEWLLDVIYNDGVEYPNKALTALTKSSLTNSNPKKLYDEDVTIEELKNMQGNSIILWVGHGAYSSEYHSSLILTTKYTDAIYDEFSDDFTSHRLETAIIGDTEYVAVTSLFFDKYLKDGVLENSIVYLATCHSAEDDVLASAFLNKGAAAVYGNSDEVWQSYNNRMCKTVLENLCNGDTTEGALQKAKDKHGKTDTELYVITRNAYVCCYGENDLTLSSLRTRVESDSTTEPKPGKTENNTTPQPIIPPNEPVQLKEVKMFDLPVYSEKNVLSGNGVIALYYETEITDVDGWKHTDCYSLVGGKNERWVRYDLNANYSFISGSLYDLNTSGGESWLDFYDGETYIASTSRVGDGVSNTTFTIDVTGVKYLTVYFRATDYGTWMIADDITLIP